MEQENRINKLEKRLNDMQNEIEDLKSIIRMLTNQEEIFD